MIKSLKAVNLNRKMTFDLRFHEDINVITGKNGSGKTTLLKLLWYAISGNLERIVPEITFDSFELVTDKMTIGMTIDRDKPKGPTLKLKYGDGTDRSRELERPIDRSMDWKEMTEVNQLIARNGASIFFPTFRRIEGGFSISSIGQDPVRYSRNRVAGRVYDAYYAALEMGGLQQATNQLSDRLSVGAHRFVASISTDDIVRLSTSKYAEISERTNRLHMELSQSILGQLTTAPITVGGRNEVEFGPAIESEPQAALEAIRSRASSITAESKALLRPFTVLNDLIAQVFQYRGIKLAGPLTLGDAAEAIASETLSAGEKQMLSFLCYNAFASESCLFIDEPEISLHVDWQRVLFPILLDQSAGNQFIVATHSPFIYSKYADKELVLDSNRGNEDADAEDDRGGDHQLPRQDEPPNFVGGRRR